MSSPAHQRSPSRGGSRTPAAIPSTEEQGPSKTQSRSPSRGRSRTPTATKANGAVDRRTRSRSRSPSRGRTRSRSRSYRARSYSRSRSRSRSPSHSRSRSRSPSRTSSPPRSAKIVIEKLTKNVNSSHLQEIFSTYGPISSLEVPLNRPFLTNKGIAYVLYTSPKYAEEAIAHMHEAQLDGAEISVSIVLPRRRFSRSPPPRRPAMDRFGEPRRLREDGGAGPGGRGGGGGRMPDRAFGRPIPPPRGDVGFRGGRRSPMSGPPPPSYRGGRGGGGGGGYRDREYGYDSRPPYHGRSRSPSRSPPRQGSAGGRRRSPSYSSRSRSFSRSPPRRGPPGGAGGRGGGGAGFGGSGGGGGRGRSPSYSSYSGRSRSRSRDGRGGGRR